MKARTLVKICNIVAIAATLLLMYWVFVFISVEVFGLKVFRKNITETFAMSIMGIIALLVGALFINIMLNLTIIANKQEEIISHKSSFKNGKKLGYLFLLSFPLIFGLLLLGDHLTIRKKEKMLEIAAKTSIKENKLNIDKMFDYEFNRQWIKQASTTLELISNTDKNLEYVTLIFKDSIDQNTTAYLSFRIGTYLHIDTGQVLRKHDFIYKSDKEEKEYFESIFSGKSTEVRFTANDGNYELFYPIIKGNKKMILYFNDYQRYGKIGS